MGNSGAVGRNRVGSRGFTLAETLIVALFLSMLLALTSWTLAAFLRARTRTNEADDQTQMIRSLITLVIREVESSIKIISTAPNLKFQQTDYADLTRLPATFPSPDPDRSPAWDPEAKGRVEISYRFDASDRTLKRAVKYPAGTTAETVVLQSVTGFSVTASGTSDLKISLDVQGKSKPEHYGFSIHRIDS